MKLCLPVPKSPRCFAFTAAWIGWLARHTATRGFSYIAPPGGQIGGFFSYLRSTRLGRYASRLSPAAFAWAFAAYLGLWFVGAFVVTLWRMWPK